MSKKALLIGINYRNTPNELAGCINDMIQWHSLLLDVYGFDENDIVFLRDDKSAFLPTKKRIIDEFDKLMKLNSDYIFVGYSGHGTSIADNNTDEADGNDECIVPCDFYSNGIIRDDELNALLKDNTSTGLMVFDCCRSGTVLDLPYNNLSKTQTAISIPLKNKIISISGCQDTETSAEVTNLDNMLPQGALSISLIRALRTLKYFPKINDLFKSACNIISYGGLTQKPNISSSYVIDDKTDFPFKSNTVDITNENNKLKDQNTQLIQQINDLNNTVKKLNDQINTQNSTAQNDSSNQLKTQITQLTTQSSKLTTQNNQLNSKINDLNTQINQLKVQNGQLVIQNRDLSSKLNQLQAKSSKLISENRMLNSKITSDK